MKIARYGSRLMQSGGKQAYRDVAVIPRIASEMEWGRVEQVAVGDLAYRTRRGIIADGAVVTAWRGNVVVTVAVEGGSSTRDLVAEKLAAGVLKQIPFS